MPRSGFAGSYGNSIFSFFWGASIPSPIVAVKCLFIYPWPDETVKCKLLTNHIALSLEFTNLIPSFCRTSSQTLQSFSKLRELLLYKPGYLSIVILWRLIYFTQHYLDTFSTLSNFQTEFCFQFVLWSLLFNFYFLQFPLECIPPSSSVKIHSRDSIETPSLLYPTVQGHSFQ